MSVGLSADCASPRNVIKRRAASDEQASGRASERRAPQECRRRRRRRRRVRDAYKCVQLKDVPSTFSSLKNTTTMKTLLFGLRTLVNEMRETFLACAQLLSDSDGGAYCIFCTKINNKIKTACHVVNRQNFGPRVRR